MEEVCVDIASLSSWEYDDSDVSEQVCLQNGVQLLAHMAIDDTFLTELAASGCITCSETQQLLKISQSRDRVGKLIALLASRNVSVVNKFVGVLAKDHAHLVPLLVSNGGDIHFVNLLYFWLLLTVFYIF